jgi:hypothetical protein
VTSTKGISGVAVAALGVGGILVWSGINNQDLITSLRYLAMGEEIPKGEQKQMRPFVTQGPGDPLSNADNPYSGSGGNQRIVDIAASYKGRPYVFGGGHGTVCPSGGMDCSGYASCVLNRAGVMRGTLTTDGFKSWGASVKFADRKPGDILVWTGGAGGGHMGIAIDGTKMWHSPCTGCGGVQIASYGPTRTGRQTIVRRAKSG